MNPCSLLFLLLFPLFANAQAGRTVLRPGQSLRDADSLYAQLKANHPALYANIAKRDADAAFRKLRARLGKPMDRQDLLTELQSFMAIFRDGHTFMDIDFESPELAAYEGEGGRFFPLHVAIIGGRLYVRNKFGDSAVAAGDEIRSINGQNAASLVKSLAAAFPADNDESARASVARLFPLSLWQQYRWGSDTRLEVTGESGTRTVRVAGISKTEMLDRMFAKGRTREMSLYPAERLAVVTIRAYNQEKLAFAFIDSCFRVMKDAGVQNVALDLRTNGGGNSEIGTYFIAHLTRQPLQTTRQKSWRMGPLLQRLPMDHWLRAAAERSRSTGRAEGDYLHSAGFGPESLPTLRDTSLFLPARFFLLTSARTFSSAHMTALSTKCSGIGTIIGQPSGERLDLTGETLEYLLPESKLVAVIPAAQYRSACGDGKTVGVQPDIYVAPRASDLRTGRDVELEALRALLQKEKRP